MKIIFFVNKNKRSATSRFRGYLVSKQMNNFVNTKIYKIDEIYNRYKINRKRFRNFFKYLKIIYKCKKNDVIYLVKTVYNIDFLILILIAKFFRKKIIFDFDDTIYLKPFTKFSTNILVLISDKVVVGSNELYKWVKKRIKMYLNCQQQFLLKNIINQKKKLIQYLQLAGLEMEITT